MSLSDEVKPMRSLETPYTDNEFCEVAIFPDGSLSWPGTLSWTATREQRDQFDALQQFLAHRQSHFQRQGESCPFCEYGVSVPPARPYQVRPASQEAEPGEEGN